MNSQKYFQIVVIIAVIVLTAGEAANEVTTAPTTNTSSDYYTEPENKANWFQAFNNCSARHMSLVTLDTKEKTDALTAELRKIFGSDHPNLWIGANDNQKNREFVWMATNQPFSYTNWARGQPYSKRGKEHCVMLWKKHDYGWNDGDCKSTAGYVCEKKR